MDILHELDFNPLSSSSIKSLSNHDLRLAEMCLFLLKEVLLDLMDNVFRPSTPCQIVDVLRRRRVQNFRRLPYSGRTRLHR